MMDIEGNQFKQVCGRARRSQLSLGLPASSWAHPLVLNRDRVFDNGDKSRTGQSRAEPDKTRPKEGNGLATSHPFVNPHSHPLSPLALVASTRHRLGTEEGSTRNASSQEKPRSSKHTFFMKKSRIWLETGGRMIPFQSSVRIDLIRRFFFFPPVQATDAG